MSSILTQADRSGRIAELSRHRDRDWVLRISGVITLVGVAIAWATSQPLLGRLSAQRRWTNFLNFSEQLIPAPVRKSGDWADALPWAWELLIWNSTPGREETFLSLDGGIVALVATIAIAAAAIILAAGFVFPCLPLASRKLASIRPFGLRPGEGSQLSQWFWRISGPCIRGLFVLSRSIPEYLLAFLLLSLLGLQVWPIVLALAIHNFGILGRLWGEVIENTSDSAAVHCFASGGSRTTTYLTATVPGVLNRFLIYFFYRWETCVKDATVLGMLGLLTLGKLIALSKGFFWDEMFFYVLLGSSVIVSMDLLSTWVRRRLR